MNVLTLHNYFQNEITLVENTFIDQYMAKANGEYVKVYLLLLRHLNHSELSLSISQMADCLENTEGDIIRALRYWEKSGLFTLEYDQTQQITGIDFGAGETDSGKPISDNVTTSDIPMPASDSGALVTAPLSPSATTVAGIEEKQTLNRKELKQILFIAEQYLGKTLSRTDVDAITYFYDTLNFSADLIEYLIEYCVENGHKSMHYIQKVALAWSDEHITTVQQARNSSALYNRNCYSVLNAFGIKGRGPAASELDYIRKWFETDSFDQEIILEACSRTVLAIHQPSFEYADKILQNWKQNRVHTLKDVHSQDMIYEQVKAASKKPTPRTSVKPSAAPSKFRNFEERSYDMDELTKELLNTN